MRHRLLFHPDYRAANPYQALLYAAVDPDFQSTPGDLGAAAQALRDAPFGARVILHLHWEDSIYRMEPDAAAAGARADAFLAELDAFKDRGGILVWTLHNAQPHDDRYLEVHQRVASHVAAVADLVIVHGHHAAAYAATERQVPASRLAILPHGHYTTLHPPPHGGRAAARTRLGLPAEATLFLLFGRLGGYKGGQDLLPAFAAMRDRTAHLVVAGRQIEPLGDTTAALAADVRLRISVDDRFVPADVVALHLAAADAVVLPYRRILCSGAVMLAMGAGRPVIVPDLPPLLETVHDGRNGLTYDASRSPEALTTALDRFAVLSPTDRELLEQGAALTARGHDWATAGLILSGLLRQTIARAQPVRRLG